MKRYLLFAGSIDYPSGGWDDFRGSFEGAMSAACAGEDYIEKDRGRRYGWYHVVDSATWQVVGRYRPA